MNQDLNEIKPSDATRPKSPARVAAGKRNGHLGVGRKTAEGLAAASQNAFKHGYHARAFSVLPTENRDCFDNFAQTLLEDLKPSSPRQCLLAEQIIRYHWLLQRNFRLEETILTSEIVTQHNTRQPGKPVPSTQLATSFAYDAVLNRNNTLNAIYRHRGQIQRELARAHKQLDDLQAQDASAAIGAARTPFPFLSDEMYLQEADIRRPEGESEPEEIQNSSNEGNAAKSKPPNGWNPSTSKPLRE